ncbi:YxeA family protein [Enterococcus sp. LJL90]
MKIIKILMGFAVIIIIGLGGLFFFTANSSGEVAAVIDRFNPLVQEGAVYVKTKAADSVNGYGTASYRQSAVDENGKERQIEFTADHELIQERYLKISNKGAYVETYEEVTAEELPVKALQALENN